MVKSIAQFHNLENDRIGFASKNPILYRNQWSQLTDKYSGEKVRIVEV